MSEPIREEAPYAPVAAALREIADRLDTLDSSNAAPSHVSIDIHAGARGEADLCGAIDVVGLVVLGERGETKRLAGGTYHHGADGRVGPVRVSVYNQVPDPRTQELRAELAKLQARIAEIEGGA